MRISRTQQLIYDSATLHMYWRCHNKEYYLQQINNKNLYMSCIQKNLKKHTHITISSFCVMDNHFHQIASYKNGSKTLSDYMRSTHSLFGQAYNKLNSRSGKVAESRPKTSLIQDYYHEMKAHFYVEANPIRAGKCKIENLKYYKFNSYKWYAFGIKDKWDKILTQPSWYTELGKTARERQRKYRKLFYEYIMKSMPYEFIQLFKNLFIGTNEWMQSHIERLQKNKFVLNKDTG